jgi:hypothetical protein
MMNCKSAKLTTKIPTILFYEIIKKKHHQHQHQKKETIPSHFISYIPTLLHKKNVGYGKLKITPTPIQQIQNLPTFNQNRNIS